VIMGKPGSPAFGLGVFFVFCFSLPVFGEEAAGPAPATPENRAAAEYALSSEGGSLWVDGEHGSGFWAASLFLKGGPLYATAGAGGVFSDFPAFDTEYTGAWFNSGLDAAPPGFPLGIDLSGGLFRRDTLTAEAAGFPLTNDGANGYFLRLALPLRLGDWSVAPSGFLAQGFWEDGDLYWFFGKPQVPSLFAIGLSAAFREEQRLYFQYLSLDLNIPDPNILSPSGEKLFTSHFDGVAAAYRRSLKRGPFRLDAASGWLFLGGGMEGGLSSGNQPYFLFPYVFYNAAFDARLHALFGLFEAEYRRGVFRLKTSLGAAHIIWGEIDADIHSKQKEQSYLGIPIFDEREEFYSRSFDPGGLGAAFLSIEGGLADMPLGRPSPDRERRAPRLSLTARKLFAVPWGYERLRASGDEPDTGATPPSAGEGLSPASILLSGLSFFCSIAW
jgi:hypothetical protein